MCKSKQLSFSDSLLFFLKSQIVSLLFFRDFFIFFSLGEEEGGEGEGGEEGFGEASFGIRL